MASVMASTGKQPGNPGATPLAQPDAPRGPAPASARPLHARHMLFGDRDRLFCLQRRTGRPSSLAVSPGRASSSLSTLPPNVPCGPGRRRAASRPRREFPCNAPYTRHGAGPPPRLARRWGQQLPAMPGNETRTSPPPGLPARAGTAAPHGVAKRRRRTGCDDVSRQDVLATHGPACYHGNEQETPASGWRHVMAIEGQRRVASPSAIPIPFRRTGGMRATGAGDA